MNLKEFYQWGKEYLGQSSETSHLTFEEGTVNSDVVLKVFTALAFQLQLNIDHVKLGQSLENYESMDAEQMEALIANVFLERRPGAKSRVTQTLYFREQTSFNMSTDVGFVSRTGVKFFPDGAVSVKGFQMRREQIDTTIYWAVDVPLVAAAEGEDHDVPAGEITTLNEQPEKFVFTTNKAASVGGYDFESNAELKDRAERAIATRDNVSDNSIYTVFNQEFGDIHDLYSTGYLHPDMQRDVLRASGCWMHHNGGMTDVYVKMAPESVTRTVKLVDGKYFRIRGFVKNTTTKFWETYASTLYPSVDYDRFPVMHAEGSDEEESCAPGPVLFSLKTKKGDLEIPFVMQIMDFTERFSCRERIDILVDGLHHSVLPTLIFLEDVIDFMLPVGTMFTASDDRTYSLLESVTVTTVNKEFTFSNYISADKVGEDSKLAANELESTIEEISSVTHPPSVPTDLLADGTIDVSYKTHARLNEYQQFAELPSQKPIVVDILFKNFVPVVVEEVIIGYADDNIDPVVTRTVQQAIRDYIFNWKSNLPIYLSDLVLEVSKNTGILFPELGSQIFLTDQTSEVIDTDYSINDIHKITTSPIYVKYRQYNSDGTHIVRETTTQISAIMNNEVQSSEWTVRYYVKDSDSTNSDTVIKLENPLSEKRLNPEYGGIR